MGNNGDSFEVASGAGSNFNVSSTKSSGALNFSHNVAEYEETHFRQEILCAEN